LISPLITSDVGAVKPFNSSKRSREAGCTVGTVGTGTTQANSSALPWKPGRIARVSVLLDSFQSR